MNTGKLDRRIILQKRVLSQDATGSRVQVWDTHMHLWAEQVAQKGSEATHAAADKSQVAQQWRIRHRTLNSSDYRIAYKGTFYDIRGITEEGRSVSLLLDTVATQAVF